MAFKITATDQKRLTAAFGDLTAERAKLEDSVRVFNEAIAAARATLQADVDTFNEKVQAVRGLVEDVHRELDEEFDTRSDNWRDSEKGEQTRQWIDSIDSFAQELTDAALDSFPETLEFEDVIGDDPVDDYNELDKEPQLDV